MKNEISKLKTGMANRDDSQTTLAENLTASDGGLGCSPDTVKVVTAIMVALLRETLSRDVFELAMGAAEREALAAGVPEQEFKRVSDRVTKFWAYRKSTNPLASLF